MKVERKSLPAPPPPVEVVVTMTLEQAKALVGQGQKVPPSYGSGMLYWFIGNLEVVTSGRANIHES